MQWAQLPRQAGHLAALLSLHACSNQSHCTTDNREQLAAPALVDNPPASEGLQHGLQTPASANRPWLSDQFPADKASFASSIKSVSSVQGFSPAFVDSSNFGVFTTLSTLVMSHAHADSKKGSQSAAGTALVQVQQNQQGQQSPTIQISDTPAAVALALTSPLSSMCSHATVPADFPSQFAHYISAQEPSLNSWELCTAAWALAYLGKPSDPETRSALQQIQKHLKSRLNFLPLSELVLLLWVLAVLDGHCDFLTEELWQLVVSQLARFSVRDYDEFSSLYLVHAAMLYIAAMNRSSSGSGTAGPRPTKDEVLKELPFLPRKVKDRLLSAYQEHVPMHPAVDGPYMSILFVLKQLAEADKAEPDSLRHLNIVTPAVSKQAASILANPRELSWIKRDCLYYWRSSDSLLDPRQKAMNDMVYFLQRRLGQTVQQPADADILLPSRNLAVFVYDDTASTSANDSEPLSLDRAQGTLESLIRDNFTPRGHISQGACVGVEDAKLRMMSQRGWRVVGLSLKQWSALANDREKEAFLNNLVKQR